MYLLVVEAECSESIIRAGREGSRWKGEMQQRKLSFVASLACFENSADLLVGGGGGAGAAAAVVHVEVVEAEGAVVEGDSGIPLKLVNLARAVVTA